MVEVTHTLESEKKTNPLTIIVGGKAGEGVKKAAQVITQTCLRMGRYVFQTDDYQSLIKGGHNFSVLSTDVQPVHSTYELADIIICFDNRSYLEHKHQLRPSGNLVYNSDETSSETDIGIPFNQLVKDIYGTKSNPSVGAIAVFTALFGFSKEQLLDIVGKAYKSNAEQNALFATKIYEAVFTKVTEQITLTRGGYFGRLYSGNQLIILGAYAAGLDFYYGYPMTPASSLLHYAAGLKDKLRITAVHAESELAAINMAIGSAFAGCRSAVGSSGGGFALMQEAFSMSGMAEAPLLCILSSRPGPATGVSTYTAQEDLFFALHQGHGEFARVVASPDRLERAFTLSAELLAIAWRFQIPVILLTEKHLSESMTNVKINPALSEYAEPVHADTQKDYQRYQIVDDSTGVSPMAFPPSEQSIKWNSHEHLQSGLRTDKAADMIAMKQKRHRKYKEILAYIENLRTVAVYGEGDYLIFAYGSTALSIREAMKNVSKPVKLIVPIYLEPFPIEQLAEYQNKTAVVVEYSIEGSFAKLLQSKLNIQTEISRNGLSYSTVITRYDGRPFDPLVLASQIEEVLI